MGLGMGGGGEGRKEEGEGGHERSVQRRSSFRHTHRHTDTDTQTSRQTDRQTECGFRCQDVSFLRHGALLLKVLPALLRSPPELLFPSSLTLHSSVSATASSITHRDTQTHISNTNSLTEREADTHRASPLQGVESV
eukprot:3388995-Rhodomonas_salina.2